MTAMTVRSAIGRRGPAVITMAVGATVMVGASLVPWVRTGGVRRSSYDLLSLVERLGFAPDGPAESVLRWWPLMPLLAAVAVVAAWWGWPRAGGLVGIGAAIYGGGVGLAVGRVSTGLVDVEPGPVVTFVGALILGAGSLAAIVVGWKSAAVAQPHGEPEEPVSSTSHER
jgi:hypothetical protein